MMRFMSFLSAVAILASCNLSSAASIDSNDIPGGGPSSYTSIDGLLTLTPTSGGSASTIGGGGSGCCFGVSNDSINDSDGDPGTTGDQEAMLISLDASAVLDSVSFIFTRATGDDPADIDEGIRISGFLSDPLVSFYSEDNPGGTLNNLPGEVEVIGFSGDTLVLNHSWRGGAVTVFEFANPAATLGQTLSITVADRDESNPQANLRTITYSQVPEPGALLMIMSAALLSVYRRN